MFPGSWAIATFYSQITCPDVVEKICLFRFLDKQKLSENAEHFFGIFVKSLGDRHGNRGKVRGSEKGVG